jgi:hypothetical protein
MGTSPELARHDHVGFAWTKDAGRQHMPLIPKMRQALQTLNPDWLHN